MTEPMWATGPGEILRHGIDLLSKDSDTNRRLAMISIDNSVELMLQTYIRLPKRITNIDISRKEREEICSNFPSILDGIERYAAEKIIGIDLGEIEWFHRLRNELYHQGNGLTVERQKVEFYGELAKLLFENLYGSKLQIPETRNMERLGEFIGSWIEIEKLVAKINGDPSRPYIAAAKVITKLLENGEITAKEMKEFQELRTIRNEVVHGISNSRDKISTVEVGMATKWISKLEAILAIR